MLSREAAASARIASPSRQICIDFGDRTLCCKFPKFRNTVSHRRLEIGVLPSNCRWPGSPTLKNRAPSSVVQLFIDPARQLAKHCRAKVMTNVGLAQRSPAMGSLCPPPLIHQFCIARTQCKSRVFPALTRSVPESSPSDNPQVVRVIVRKVNS